MPDRRLILDRQEYGTILCMAEESASLWQKMLSYISEADSETDLSNDQWQKPETDI